MPEAMKKDALGAYPPLNTLKPVAEDVWIVDGPLIEFALPYLRAPFSTRMTVIRLPGERLLIHSPTPLTDELKAEVAKIGTPAWLIGPNRLHYWWIPDWRAAYPEARVFLAPRIREQAKGRIDVQGELLERERNYPWDEQIATLPIRGRFMTEVVFFHRPTRTLVLTDLLENFEPGKIRSWAFRLMTRLGGVLDPDGQTPRDMRLTFDRSRIREAARIMIGWAPERVILAHGRWYDSNGVDELRRGFRWALR